MILKHDELFYSYATTSTLAGESFVKSAVSSDLVSCSTGTIVSKHWKYPAPFFQRLEKNRDKIMGDPKR